MITNTERKQIKKVLVSKWIPDVIEKLTKNNILNKKGQPYTKAFISHVFNGKHEQHFIESAILDVYQERIQQHAKMRAEKKAKLKKPSSF